MKRKAFSKTERETIRSKTCGKCGYCGNELGSKFHIDHIIPIYAGGDDSESNLLPSCVSCNLFKSVLPLEEFRTELCKQIDRARKSSVNFRNAERFGLIEVTGKPVIFYFEIIKENIQCHQQ